MADVHSLQVVLDRDVSTEEAEPLMRAIEQMKGVIAVAHVSSSIESYMAEERARTSAKVRIAAFFNELFKEW